MRTIHFDVLGLNRTYWDFFVGSGFSVSLFFLFAAILSWQLGGLSPKTLTLMPVVSWSLAILFVGITVLSCLYLFIVPIVFSALISLCLITAAWISGRSKPA